MHFIDRLLNPRKTLHHYGLKGSFLLKSHRCPFLPQQIDVEPVNVCNLRCPHCQVTHRSATPVFLEPAAFEHILSQFPTCEQVKIQGMGEPFLHAGLPAMAEKAAARSVAVRIITNGTVTDADYARLFTVPRLSVSVSVDGPDPETQERIRPGSSLETVLGTLRKLAGLRRPGQGVGVSTVIVRDNVRRLPEMVRLARQNGAQRINIQTSLTDWGKEDQQSANSRFRAAPAEVAEGIAAARAEAAAAGIKITVLQNNRYTATSKCPWPWKSTFISAAGDVVPCCTVADPSVTKMGNILESPFLEIWNGDAYRSLRKKLAAGEVPSFCNGCYRVL